MLLVGSDIHPGPLTARRFELPNTGALKHCEYVYFAHAPEEPPGSRKGHCCAARNGAKCTWMPINDDDVHADWGCCMSRWALRRNMAEINPVIVGAGFKPARP